MQFQVLTEKNAFVINVKKEENGGILLHFHLFLLFFVPYQR